MKNNRNPLPLQRDIFDFVYKYSKNNPPPPELHRDSIEAITNMAYQRILERREAEAELEMKWSAPVRIPLIERVHHLFDQMSEIFEESSAILTETWPKIIGVIMHPPALSKVAGGKGMAPRSLVKREVRISTQTEDRTPWIIPQIDKEVTGALTLSLLETFGVLSCSLKVEGEAQDLVGEFEVELKFVEERDDICQEVVTSDLITFNIGREQGLTSLGKLLADKGRSLEDSNIHIIPNIYYVISS